MSQTVANRIAPTIDLHSHLRGTIDPYTARALAQNNNVHFPAHHLNRDGKYHWTDFPTFLQAYQDIGNVVRTSSDLNLLATRYLRRCAAEGTVYVEFMLSPNHSMTNGISYPDQISAIAEAIAALRQETGIEANLIVTSVRHRGAREATALAELVVDNLNTIVVGFGLTGNEHYGDIADFSAAFSIAHQAGLGLTAHTGEWLDARSIVRTVDALGLSRVGHGVAAANDPAILRDLVDRGIGFEICISSNVALGLFDEPEHHVLPAMIDAGCKISLCTDDAAYFGTSPASERAIAAHRLGLSQAQLDCILRDSIEMAFCDEATKEKLKQSIG